jgi:hypothetical protein
MSFSKPQRIPSFHVDQISNCLDGIVCKEVVDRDTVYKLINSTLLLDEYSEHYKYVKLLHENERNQMVKYLQRIDEGDGVAGIPYHRKKDGFGRSDPDGGVGGFMIRRALRALLFYGHMVDIDIVNAHPVILSILCRIENVSCSHLDEYIANRESILADTCAAYGCSRDDAKTLFIRLAYGGGLKSWVEDCKIASSTCRDGMVVNGVIIATPFVAKIKVELVKIAVHVWRKNKHLLPIIRARKGVKKYNEYATLLSLVLQEHECRVLECVFKFCVSKGYIRKDEAVLAADGLQLNKDLVPNDIADQISAEVFDKLGFDLKFIVKPFDVSITPEILDKSLLYCLHLECADSDFSIAQFFVAMYGNRYIRKSGEKNMRFYTGVYWKELKDTDACKDFLSITFAAQIKKAFDYHVKKLYDAAAKEKAKARSLPVKVQSGIDVGLSSGVCMIDDDDEVVFNTPDGSHIVEPGASAGTLLLDDDEQPSDVAEPIPALATGHESDASTDVDMPTGRPVAAAGGGRGRKRNAVGGKVEKVQSALDIAIDEIDKKVNQVFKNISQAYRLITVKLKDSKHRNGIMSIVSSLVTRDDIEFDQHPMLFAFNNKIYDLEAGYFIEPRPELYISSTCGWDYDDNYPSSRVDELRAVVASIFPNIDIRNFALSFYASGMIAKLIEALVVLIGTGRNGKGVLSGLMLSMLGPYGYKLPASLIQGPLEMGANPQVANMAGKRFCIMAEPVKGLKICCSTMKELTGDTDLNTRGLYQSETHITICPTLGLECNEPIPLDDTTGGSFIRYNAIAFLTVFISQAKYNELSEDRKPLFGILNPEYKTDAWRRAMRQALFIVLAGTPLRAVLDAGGALPPAPPVCEALAKKHIGQSDAFYEFLLAGHCREENPAHVLSIPDLFSAFKVSDIYRSLVAHEKKKYGNRASTLSDLIREHGILGHDFVKRGRRYGGGEKLTVDCLVNWRCDADDEVVDGMEI